MTPRICRCGQILDARGLCPHCDTPATCSADCVECRTRDSWCVACGTWRGTKSAALACENGHRKGEGKGKA